MATTRIGVVIGVVLAVVLPLLVVSSASAQTYYRPVYGPWGVYYVPYTLSSPSPIVRASAPSSYGAASSSDSRPSYYSEDYTGPQGPTNEPSKVAYIRVRVPTNAVLWINNEKRSQAGAVREFVTPALDPDQVYVYNVKARWTEDGGINVEKTLRVRTISGTRVTVNFVRPPEARPRQTVATPVVVRPRSRALQVEEQPVDWTSNSVAPRSLHQGGR